MAEAKDELLDHDYDGIQEYDNPLPRWWLYLFYICLVYGIFYIPYYGMGYGATPQDDWKASMEEWNELHPKVELAGADEMAKHCKDPAKIAAGKEIFGRVCMACHAADGGGLVGPNLTDDFWLHGGDPVSIAKTIYDGVPAKGMIAWKSQLSLDEIYAATAFIYSLHGTTPAKPKDPQGEKYERPAE